MFLSTLCVIIISIFALTCGLNEINADNDEIFNVMDDSVDLVRKLCLHDLEPKHVESIEQIIEFKNQFETVLKRYNEETKFKLSVATTYEENAILRCINEQESILKFVEIVASHNYTLCTQTHVNKLTEFKNDYIHNHSWFANMKEKGLVKGIKEMNKKHKVMVRELFEAYSMEISYHCQKKLVDKLTLANKILDNDQFLKVMPWLRIKNRRKRKRLFPTQLPDCTKPIRDVKFELIDREPEREQPIGDYNLNEATMLTDMFGIKVFKNIANSTKFVLPSNQKIGLDSIREGCAKFKPYLDATVMPIVRLAYLGYGINVVSIKDTIMYDESLRRWLVVSQLCLIFESLNIIADGPDDGPPIEIETEDPIENSIEKNPSEDSFDNQTEDTTEKSNKLSQKQKDQPNEIFDEWEFVQTKGDIEAAKELDPENKFGLSGRLVAYTSHLDRVYQKSWFAKVMKVFSFIYGGKYNQKGRDIVMFFRGKDKSERMNIQQFLTSFEQRMKGQSENSSIVDRWSRFYTLLGVVISVLFTIVIAIPGILTMSGVITSPFAG